MSCNIPHPLKNPPTQGRCLLSLVKTGLAQWWSESALQALTNLRDVLLSTHLMKNTILLLTVWLAACAAVSAEGTREQGSVGRCPLFPAKCFAQGLLCTGVLLSAKHIFSCNWSFYSEKWNARKFCAFWLIFLPLVLFFWDSLDFTGITRWCWYMWRIRFYDQRRTKKWMPGHTALIFISWLCIKNK